MPIDLPDDFQRVADARIAALQARVSADTRRIVDDMRGVVSAREITLGGEFVGRRGVRKAVVCLDASRARGRALLLPVLESSCEAGRRIGLHHQLIRRAIARKLRCGGVPWARLSSVKSLGRIVRTADASYLLVEDPKAIKRLRTWQHRRPARGDSILDRLKESDE